MKVYVVTRKKFYKDEEGNYKTFKRNFGVFSNKDEAFKAIEEYSGALNQRLHEVEGTSNALYLIYDAKGNYYGEWEIQKFKLDKSIF